ncbi:MAG TPA: glycoside hydrolase family 3 protein [Candidatus Paceibacterota bacterium]|nr:glycoside hydrolase family 3 protein [Candidatus Paceibacterota bacterium]
MKKRSLRAARTAVAAIAAVSVALLCIIVAERVLSERTEPPAPPADAPYLNPDLPINVRVNDLLSYMTLEEKAGQMALVDKNSVHDDRDLATYGIGALLSGAGAKPSGDDTAMSWRDMVARFTDASRESRLKIPVLYGVDAAHGHANVPGATVFPHEIGLGAAGDPKLVRAVARATAAEMSATGIYWNFAPDLDQPRDIRWGRTYEAFSDDPELVSLLGAAYVRGLEEPVLGGASSTVNVLATAKHFVGVGSMAWGSSSNRDFKIDQGTTPPDEDALETEYLPAFREAVAAGVSSVMVGLNSWGDTKLAADRHLITDVLKGDLGFDGFVVSDWYGVYEIPGNDYSSAVTAINAGVDMVMLPFDYEPFVRNVVRAVEDGDIPEARIDDAVRRVLRAKFALGLFDGRTPGDGSVVGSKSNRALAREAVARSLVLLKNDRDTLPLRNVETIRVAGSAADNIGRQAGAWTVEWQGIDGNWLPGATSILEGIRERAGANVTVAYDKNGDFPTGDRADVGIAVVGEAPYAEGWGDNARPSLTNDDRAAIAKLRASCDEVVVIIVSGRPLLISDELSSWDALVAAWLPGSEGEGVADVLFGDEPFSGVLPVPWPDHEAQFSIAVDGSTADHTAVLFPRYFGLH